MRLSLPFFKIAIGALLPAVVITSIKHYLFNNQSTPPTAPNTLELPSIPTLLALPTISAQEEISITFDDEKSADSKYSFVNQKFLERRKDKDTTETKSIESIGYLEDNLKSIETKYSVVNQDLIDLRNRETTETRLMEIITSVNEENDEERKLLYKAAYHENCHKKCINFLLGTLEYGRNSKEKEITPYLIERAVELELAKQTVKI